MKLANDSWTSKCLEYDKWTHAGGSCLATMVLYLFWFAFGFNSTFSILAASLLSFTAGLAIEIDQGIELYGALTNGDGFSWRDMAANMIGILVAMVGVLI